ncbi:MAG: ZmpA/ZmpB/ZmpC family metallo-endopeptidase-related protein [Acholeplasmataceae bacterium]|nr:ZmpA/ZmpB/ZmpC family metallo-endopeptidase-related protein [Acholeplasmataceae bacterium]
MKKMIGIIFAVLTVFLLVGCKEDLNVTAEFSDVEIGLTTITFTVDIDDPDAKITGVVTVKLHKADGTVAHTKDVTTDQELVGYNISSLINSENYTIKIYATIGRDSVVIGEYQFKPLSAATMTITTTEEFLNMKNNRAGNYVLGNDLDFTGVTFTTPFTAAFSGTFDGQGNTISNITFTNIVTYTGVFGYVSSGTIKNVNFDNINIGTATTPLTMTTSSRTGIVAGYVSSSIAKIENVKVSNSTINYSTSSTVQAFVGGLVGELKGEMVDAELDNVLVKIRTTSYGRIRVGGAVGLLTEDAKLKQVKSDATVDVTLAAAFKNRDVQINVGGLIGYHNARNVNRSVEDIYTTGSIQVDVTFGTTADSTSGNYSVYAGGIAGIAYSNVVNAFFGGSIDLTHVKNDNEAVTNKNFYVGGLMGFYGSNKVVSSAVRLGDGEEININVSDDVKLRASQTFGQNISSTVQNAGIFGAQHLMINMVDETATDTSTVYTSLTSYFTSDWMNAAYNALP